MLEYLAARVTSSTVSSMEETVTTMLFCCLRCPVTEQLCSTYLEEIGKHRDTLGYFEIQVLMDFEEEDYT